MKICFFGSYERKYSKNIVLLKGFKKIGVKVVHCYHPNYFTLFHYPSLLIQFIKKCRDCDIIFVAFFGHYDVWFAWLIARIFRKKVVFDPLISIYNTRIEDRKYFKKSGIKAKLYMFIDWLNINLADHVFIDTNEHFKYFEKNFGLKKDKASIIRVGADETVLKPFRRKLDKNIKLLFYGSYQPSQGALNVIRAANILKNKNFDWLFIGSGHNRKLVEKVAKDHKLYKVRFLDSIPFKQLTKYIGDADILFGAFGNTIKTNMVIRNNIYQGLCMAKAIVTQKTQAILEITEDNKTIFLSNSSPKNIAMLILKLASNKDQIEKVETNARKLFLKKFTTVEISKQAMSTFVKILN